MVYIVIMLSFILGLIGIYFGIWTFKKYTKIIHSVEPVSIHFIFQLSVWMGISGCFSFFALIAILGTIFEKKTDWSFHSILGLIGISIIFGIIGFFGSLYQIYTTVKYRNLLLDKKIIKKKE
jgi:hypothetical protein